MSHYRRARFGGGYYFFTVVTHLRRRLFAHDAARGLLREAWRKVRRDHPFEVTALCLLPEHLHTVWRLPPGDADYSIRWRLIKRYFTQAYLAQAAGYEPPQSASRQKKGERGLWQRRFWEHQIRDETDLQNHLDYIHYNPVKHGLVESIDAWPWSTYHRFVRLGYYRHRVWRDVDGDFGESCGGDLAE